MSRFRIQASTLIAIVLLILHTSSLAIACNSDGSPATGPCTTATVSNVLGSGVNVMLDNYGASTAFSGAQFYGTSITQGKYEDLIYSATVQTYSLGTSTVYVADLLLFEFRTIGKVSGGSTPTSSFSLCNETAIPGMSVFAMPGTDNLAVFNGDADPVYCRSLYIENASGRDGVCRVRSMSFGCGATPDTYIDGAVRSAAWYVTPGYTPRIYVLELGYAPDGNSPSFKIIWDFNTTTTQMTAPFTFPSPPADFTNGKNNVFAIAVDNARNYLYFTIRVNLDSGARPMLLLQRYTIGSGFALGAPMTTWNLLEFPSSDISSLPYNWNMTSSILIYNNTILGSFNEYSPFVINVDTDYGGQMYVPSTGIGTGPASVMKFGTLQQTAIAGPAVMTASTSCPNDIYVSARGRIIKISYSNVTANESCDTCVNLGCCPLCPRTCDQGAAFSLPSYPWASSYTHTVVTITATTATIVIPFGPTGYFALLDTGSTIKMMNRQTFAVTTIVDPAGGGTTLPKTGAEYPCSSYKFADTNILAMRTRAPYGLFAGTQNNQDVIYYVSQPHNMTACTMKAIWGNGVYPGPTGGNAYDAFQIAYNAFTDDVWWINAGQMLQHAAVNNGTIFTVQSLRSLLGFNVEATQGLGISSEQQLLYLLYENTGSPSTLELRVYEIIGHYLQVAIGTNRIVYPSITVFISTAHGVNPANSTTMYLQLQGFDVFLTNSVASPNLDFLPVGPPPTFNGPFANGPIGVATIDRAGPLISDFCTSDAYFTDRLDASRVIRSYLLIPYGCDHVAWSNITNDACGVCNGTNSTCMGCDGVLFSNLTYDACGVCNGTNRTCQDCRGIPNGGLVYDACGVCNGSNATCSDCAHIVFGNTTYDACGVCNGTNSTCIGCNGVASIPITLYDACGVCNGTNRTCQDCSGIVNGAHIYDFCGVCEGKGLSCYGAMNLTSISFECGSCSGVNATTDYCSPCRLGFEYQSFSTTPNICIGYVNQSLCTPCYGPPVPTQWPAASPSALAMSVVAGQTFQTVVTPPSLPVDGNCTAARFGEIIKLAFDPYNRLVFVYDTTYLVIRAINVTDPSNCSVWTFYGDGTASATPVYGTGTNAKLGNWMTGFVFDTRLRKLIVGMGISSLTNYWATAFSIDPLTGQAEYLFGNRSYCDGLQSDSLMPPPVIGTGESAAFCGAFTAFYTLSSFNAIYHPPSGRVYWSVGISTYGTQPYQAAPFYSVNNSIVGIVLNSTGGLGTHGLCAPEYSSSLDRIYYSCSNNSGSINVPMYIYVFNNVTSRLEFAFTVPSPLDAWLFSGQQLILGSDFYASSSYAYPYTRTTGRGTTYTFPVANYTGVTPIARNGPDYYASLVDYPERDVPNALVYMLQNVVSDLPTFGQVQAYNTDTAFIVWNMCVYFASKISAGSASLDSCGLCFGDNSTCLGCDGIPNSGLVYDVCGVCDGDNRTCAGCNGVPFSNVTYDACGVCNGTNRTCQGCNGVPNSGLIYDVCGVCNGSNQTCRSGCDNVPYSNKTYDACGVCGGNNRSCAGCDGIPNSGLVYDVCGVCNGTNRSCAGCDGIPYSGLVYDVCGVCNGTNSTCIGCNGLPSIPVLINDACGVCNGTNRTCAGCNGIPNSGVVYDACGVCNGTNRSCAGCDGIPNSGKIYDRCGVCNGNNLSCAGCDGIPNSGRVYDACGVCNGSNITCRDCSGVPNGPLTYDVCGVCNGTNQTCTACNGIPNANVTYDYCGVCDGHNETCIGCDGLYYPTNGTRVAAANTTLSLGIAAGSATLSGFNDGTGTSARFNLATSVAFNNVTNLLYIADQSNNAIRVMNVTTDAVTTFFSSPGATGTNSTILYRPIWIVVNSTGTLWVLTQDLYLLSFTLAGTFTIVGYPSNLTSVEGATVAQMAVDPFRGVLWLLWQASTTRTSHYDFATSSFGPKFALPVASGCANTDTRLSGIGVDPTTGSVWIVDSTTFSTQKTLRYLPLGENTMLCSNTTTAYEPFSVFFASSGPFYAGYGSVYFGSRSYVNGSAFGFQSLIAGTPGAVNTITNGPPNSGRFGQLQGCDFAPITGRFYCADITAIRVIQSFYTEVTIPIPQYDICGVCNGTNTTCFGCDGVLRMPPYVYDACGVCHGNNRSCAGCDGVPNSGSMYDACGVCNGTNSTCSGCDGVIRAIPLVYDACGVCNGTNRTCKGCDGVPNSGLVYDGCGVCNGTNRTCQGCDGVPNSAVVYDVCGVCNGSNNTCRRGCDNIPYSNATYDACGVCNGTNRTCLGCDGVPNSGLRYDLCGVCNGTNRTCAGCDGVPNSNTVYDACGVCNGTNRTCVGCDGVPNSHVIYDACGVCNGTNNTCRSGCDNVPYSTKIYDSCGVCGGNNRSCAGCDGIPNSGLVYDYCGVCNGTNSTCIGCDGIFSSQPSRYDVCNVCNGTNMTCRDCAGIPNGNRTYDACGVCNGTNTTCQDCAGIPNGVVVYDLCGVCNGTNRTCQGCNGVPNSGVIYDACGVCNGTNLTCRGCNGVPNSGLVYDYCGVCNGTNSTCLDCAGIPRGNTTYDSCGVCNGTNSTCTGCDGVVNSQAIYDFCGICGGKGLSCYGAMNLTSISFECGSCAGFNATTDYCSPCRLGFEYQSFSYTPDICIGYVNQSLCSPCYGPPVPTTWPAASPSAFAMTVVAGQTFQISPAFVNGNCTTAKFGLITKIAFDPIDRILFVMDASVARIRAVNVTDPNNCSVWSFYGDGTTSTSPVYGTGTSVKFSVLVTGMVFDLRLRKLVLTVGITSATNYWATALTVDPLTGSSNYLFGNRSYCSGLSINLQMPPPVVGVTESAAFCGRYDATLTGTLPDNGIYDPSTGRIYWTTGLSGPASFSKASAPFYSLNDSIIGIVYNETGGLTPPGHCNPVYSSTLNRIYYTCINVSTAPSLYVYIFNTTTSRLVFAFTVPSPVPPFVNVGQQMILGDDFYNTNRGTTESYSTVGLGTTYTFPVTNYTGITALARNMPDNTFNTIDYPDRDVPNSIVYMLQNARSPAITGQTQAYTTNTAFIYWGYRIYFAEKISAGSATRDSCGICFGDNSTCIGCDGVPFSGLVYDACGVCNGTNQTCLGCDGIMNSGAIYDACGVCNGTNSTCRSGCDNAPYSNATYDACGVCNGTNSTCTDCSGVLFGNLAYDACGVCNGTNQTCLGCDGIPNSHSIYDACGVCNGTNQTCMGCNGVPNSGLVFDACGVCNGTNRTCAGCDGIPNSNKTYDACAVCGGNNQSCAGCNGVPNSGLVYDSCGVCNGTNRTCQGCDGVPNSGLRYDVCGVCNGSNSTCRRGCDNIPYSNATYDVCGVCAGNNQSCAGCDGVPNSGITYDYCGVCNGTNSTCIGCDGVFSFNPARYDACNVCNGTNTTCRDCAGIPNGNRTYDACGVCNGTNATCSDCAGIPNGGRVYDLCGVCNGTNQTCQDCAGIPNGGRVYDSCGVCNGTNQTCQDCSGIPNGNRTYDLCGVCGGNNQTCQGCDGIPNSGLRYDACAVCNGTNKTCAGCDGVPNSGTIYDLCGVCNGTNRSCAGCDGIPNSGRIYDVCGVCNGTNRSCAGCDGIPNSGLIYDSCGVCNGTNRTCAGCDGVPNSQTVYDLCGICNGTNRSCAGCDGIPNSGRIYDACGVCNGTNRSCAGCDGIPNSGLVYDLCGVCNGTNQSCAGCDGVPNSGLRYDLCGVCNGTNRTCAGCDGIPNSGAIYDACGVCNGTNQTCLDCAGIPNGGRFYDACGVCNGTNRTCAGCDGVPNSGTVYDACAVCNGTNQTCLGCDGIPNSGLVYDSCGVCNGTNKTCAGCDGIPNSLTIYDACGVCNGTNRTCAGCDGVPNSGVIYDICGVCNGSNQTCTGCDGVPGSGLRYDACGVCNGTNSTCLDCRGIPFGNATYDTCGVCNGTNSTCRGCDGVLNSGALYDACGICNGTNQTCAGCDGIPNSGSVYDYCGVCNGTNSTCFDCYGVYQGNATYDACGVCNGTNSTCTCVITGQICPLPRVCDDCGVCGGNNACKSDILILIMFILVACILLCAFGGCIYFLTMSKAKAKYAKLQTVDTEMLALVDEASPPSTPTIRSGAKVGPAPEEGGLNKIQDENMKKTAKLLEDFKKLMAPRLPTLQVGASVTGTRMSQRIAGGTASRKRMLGGYKLPDPDI